MVSPILPVFTERYRELSQEINEMSKNVTRKFATLPDQLRFRHVRNTLDQLMAGISPGNVKAVQELSIRLERLAAQVQQATGSFLNEAYIIDKPSPPDSGIVELQDVIVPLCSPPRPPSSLLLPDGPVKEGMKKLDRVCDCIQIKGDGDCLFRSFATGLMCHFIGKSRELMTYLSSFLRSKEGKDISPEVWNAAKQTINALAKCHSPEDVAIIMNDEKFSDPLMMLMRHLAVAHVPNVCDETFHVTLEEEVERQGKTRREYFDSILKKGYWGGAVEYLSLKDFFCTILPVSMQDVDDIGKNKVIPHSPKQGGFDLLFHDGHYNLAIPKKIVERA